MSYKNKNVMAIGAHPDDVEFGCSGTLCNHVDSGDNVVMVVMTNTESVDGVTGETIRTREENQKDFYDGVDKGGASALLAASVFHFNQFSIKEVKQYLFEKNIAVRK